MSPFFPFGPIFAFVLCLIITLGQNYQAFLEDKIQWGGVVAKSIGTSNPYNMVRATFDALSSQTSPKSVAQRPGK